MPKLTDRSLQTLTVEPGRKDRMVFDTVCPGLGVRVTAKGTRTFLAQWTDPATKRKVREPLGIWGAITLDQARDAAKVRLGEVAKGNDPRAERLRKKAEDVRLRAETALSFDDLITDWATIHLADRRPRYVAEAQRALKYAFPTLLKRPAARVTQADAVNALDKLSKAGKAAMAGRTMAYGRACYQWARKRGKVPSNPFEDLPIAAGTSERERVLANTELAEIWSATGKLGDEFRPFVKLLMLTLQRREEVAGMRWPELSSDLKTWIIPGERMKNGKAHIVHLAKEAREILESVERVDDQDLVFTTTGETPISGFSKAKALLDKTIIEARAKVAKENGQKLEALEPWVFHDFRRSGVSWLASVGFDSIIADKLLAHKPTKLKGVASVYQRHEFLPERERALDAWATFVARSTMPSNVIPLAQAG